MPTHLVLDPTDKPWGAASQKPLIPAKAGISRNLGRDPRYKIPGQAREERIEGGAVHCHPGRSEAERRDLERLGPG